MSYWVVYENGRPKDNIVIVNSSGGGVAHFTGITDKTIKQGEEFDPKEGVTAYDKNGNEIDFTVNPSEIDVCEIGEVELTYTAGKVTDTRKITVEPTENPVIEGLDDLVVEIGEEFDPLEGVTAKDGNGNDITVEVVESETPSDEWGLIYEGSGYYNYEHQIAEEALFAVGDMLKLEVIGMSDPEEGTEIDGYSGEATATAYSNGATVAFTFADNTNGLYFISGMDGETATIVGYNGNGIVCETLKLYKKVA